MLVSPPIIEEREIHEPLFCGPGPCNLLPSVRQALTKPVMSPMCEVYFSAMAEIRAGLKYAFQTKSDLVLAISGSGHSGMEAVINNLLGPDDTLLIASRGIWDQRAYIMATRYGIKTFKTEVPINATFSFEQIENELKKLKPTALFITHGDSSTGSVQNLNGLGKICHKCFYIPRYHHTQSPPMVWALRCCLMELCKETLPKSWARHAATTAHFQKKIQDYGFEFFIPKPEDRLATVTTVVIPKRCKSDEYLRYMREKHDIVMFGGLGPTAGKVLRVGIMGVNSHVEIATKVANAMADTARAVMKSSI
ncbi:serine--pyruvate aminotransferase [Zerene cesonia]|uniref:serine--pyruvate aminotransferase n=1 Tax=Zerene cesonia TaxID=33412 RepID=UPI0018E57FEB|nr:serine--pyruvate aminotransferase [Zerene cesonia]